MNPHMLARLARPAARPAMAPHTLPRSFSTSVRLANSASVTLPAQKPVGTIRGGSVLLSFFRVTHSLTNWSLFRMFGFLLGSVVAGVSVYYYVLEEYRVSNEMLTDDIYVRYCI
jgi:hypothetical protein